MLTANSMHKAANHLLRACCLQTELVPPLQTLFVVLDWMPRRNRATPRTEQHRESSTADVYDSPLLALPTELIDMIVGRLSAPDRKSLAGKFGRNYFL
jgi:hypothetical protein